MVGGNVIFGRLVNARSPAAGQDVLFLGQE